MSSDPETSSDETGLTDDDMARIRRYLRNPTYERSADDLRPSSDT